MFRQPKALPFLFLTEMWERFGFYVVQGMLVLYMTKAYGFSDDKSFTVSGMFAALAYISPLIGGFLADRVLGFKTAVVWGGLFLIAGYALLASPFSNAFYIALAIIVVGNGLFKPNISSLLGALYAPGDSARDTGFTIFYIGINIGVLLAGLGSGYIKDHFGWNAALGLASAGLFIGLCTFAMGIKTVGMHYPFSPAYAKTKWLAKHYLVLYCVIAVGLVTLLLQSEVLGKWFLPVVGVFLLFFVFSLASHQQPEVRKNLFTLNILIISSVIFWAIFLQMFLATNLYIDRLIDRNIEGFTIPTTAFYTIESLFVILLGPLFAWSWSVLNRSNKNPSPVIKFVFAIIFAGLGFFVLAMSTRYANDAHLVNPMWIVLSYMLITIGELLLSPIGLSSVTMLSPSHLTGLMMGVWFTALGFGGQLAGVLARMASIPENAQNPMSELPIYANAFFNYAYMAFGVAFILFIVHCLMKKR